MVQVDLDHGITEDVPPHPGVNLYSITKALGQEVCRVTSENYPIHVMTQLYWMLSATAQPGPSDTPGQGVTPFAITTRDASRALHAALDVELATLPSRNEMFFIMVPSLPHGKFVARKGKELLGWEPIDTLAWHYTSAKL